MPLPLLDFGIVLLLIACTGVFTLAQVALAHSSRQKLHSATQRGDRGADRALALLDISDEVSSCLRLGSALLSVFAAMYGGIKLAPQIENGLEGLRMAAPLERISSYAIAVVLLALVTLFIGEIFPKLVALGRPEFFASVLSGPVGKLAFIFRPVVRLLNLITTFFLGVFGIRPPRESAVTEEEVKELIEQGAQEGVFEKAEETIMKRALRLGDQKIGDIMTPRTQLVCIDMREPLERNIERMVQSPHSYFPTYRGNADHITGLVAIKNLWSHWARGEKISLEEAQTKPLFVMEKISALGVLELFKNSGKHIAIVVDEHGGLAGLITVNDILQALVGDLPNSVETEKPAAIQRQDGSWLVDGMISIDEFKELFKVAALPEDSSGTYQTLAGFVMFQMGRVPRESDRFSSGGFQFEVMDMDGRRIDKVLVTPSRAKGSSARAR